MERKKIYNYQYACVRGIRFYLLIEMSHIDRRRRRPPVIQEEGGGLTGHQTHAQGMCRESSFWARISRNFT